MAVTPLAGVWIEMFQFSSIFLCSFHVTPLAGVWIEIMPDYDECVSIIVTPLAGVWIEIRSIGIL